LLDAFSGVVLITASRVVA